MNEYYIGRQMYVEANVLDSRSMGITLRPEFDYIWCDSEQTQGRWFRYGRPDNIERMMFEHGDDWLPRYLRLLYRRAKENIVTKVGLIFPEPCPECDGRIRLDIYGDLVCEDCGIVYTNLDYLNFLSRCAIVRQSDLSKNLDKLVTGGSDLALDLDLGDGPPAPHDRRTEDEWLGMFPEYTRAIEEELMTTQPRIFDSNEEPASHRARKNRGKGRSVSKAKLRAKLRARLESVMPAP